MNPRIIILYAVAVTLMITLVFTRQRPLDSRARRWLWILLSVGVLVFLVMAYMSFAS